MNKKFVAFCFSLCFFASPIASAFEGGKVIVDIRQEDNIDSLEKVSETVSSYIEDVKKYDEKYPAEQINEDFLDDVISDYPDSPEERNVLRERLIRYGIRAKRIYNTVINKAKAFMAENDIPLFVSKDDYADSSQETYKESADGKPIVVLDFKKAVGYSQTDSQKQIVVENDENGLNRYQRIQEFKKALLKGDYKKVLQYGLFDGKEISDSKGVGDWTSGANLKTRILSIPKGISENARNGCGNIRCPSQKHKQRGRTVIQTVLQTPRHVCRHLPPRKRRGGRLRAGRLLPLHQRQNLPPHDTGRARHLPLPLRETRLPQLPARPPGNLRSRPAPLRPCGRRSHDHLPRTDRQHPPGHQSPPRTNPQNHHRHHHPRQKIPGNRRRAPHLHQHRQKPPRQRAENAPPPIPRHPPPPLHAPGITPLECQRSRTSP